MKVRVLDGWHTETDDAYLVEQKNPPNIWFWRADDFTNSQDFKSKREAIKAMEKDELIWR